MNLGKKEKERKRKRKEATEPPGAGPWEEGGYRGFCEAQGVCSGASEEGPGQCQARGQRALGLDLLSKHVPGVQGSEAAEARRHWGSLPGSFCIPFANRDSAGSRFQVLLSPPTSSLIYNLLRETSRPNVKTMQGPSVTTETPGSQPHCPFRNMSLVPPRTWPRVSAN